MTDQERLRLVQIQKRKLQLQGSKGTKYPIDPEVLNEAGVQNVSMTPITKPDLEQAGEDIATSKFGQEHPIAGAAMGTVVAKADDIMAAASGVRAAPALANVAKAGGKAVWGKLSNLADALLGPGEKAAMLKAEQLTAPARQNVAKLSTALKGASNPTPELLATQEAQAGLGSQMGAQEQVLAQLKKESGAKIGQLEQGAGLKFTELSDKSKDILSNPKLLGRRAEAMARVSNKGSKALAENMTLENLQANRKFAESALRRQDLSNATRVNLAKSKGVFEEAIDSRITGFKEQLNSFRLIDQELRNLPKAMKAQANALRLNARKEMNKIRSGKVKTQAELQKAQETLDEISKEAEILVQKGQRRDILRGRVKAAAIGTAIAAGAPQILKRL